MKLKIFSAMIPVLLFFVLGCNSPEKEKEKIDEEYRRKIHEMSALNLSVKEKEERMSKLLQERAGKLKNIAKQ
jgi:hypothetical protein